MRWPCCSLGTERVGAVRSVSDDGSSMPAEATRSATARKNKMDVVVVHVESILFLFQSVGVFLARGICGNDECNDEDDDEEEEVLLKDNIDESVLMDTIL